MGNSKIISKNNHISSGVRGLLSAYERLDAVSQHLQSLIDIDSPTNPQYEQILLMRGVLTENMKKDIFNLDTLLICLNEMRQINVEIIQVQNQIKIAVAECNRLIEAEYEALIQKIMLAQLQTDNLEEIRKELENAIKNLDEQIKKIREEIAILQIKLEDLRAKQDRNSTKISDSLEKSADSLLKDDASISDAVDKKSLAQELKNIAKNIGSKSAAEIDKEIDAAISYARTDKSKNLSMSDIKQTKNAICNSNLVKKLAKRVAQEAAIVSLENEVKKLNMNLDVAIAKNDSQKEILKYFESIFQSTHSPAQASPPPKKFESTSTTAAASSYATNLQTLLLGGGPKSQKKNESRAAAHVEAKLTADAPANAVLECCNMIKDSLITKAVSENSATTLAKKVMSFDEDENLTATAAPVNSGARKITSFDEEDNVSNDNSADSTPSMRRPS